MLRCFHSSARIARGVALLGLMLWPACTGKGQGDGASAGNGGAVAAGGASVGTGGGGEGAQSGSSAGEGAQAGSSAGADSSGGAASSAGGGAQGGEAGSGARSSAGGGGEGVGGSAGEPYAHVVAVATSGSEPALTFNVSVESSDIDCSQFANWWEVLSEEGQLLYRRILLHSHTDENGTSDPDAPGNTFTRSGGPVPIDEAQVVLVRAHLSTVGYNGRVMRGSVSGGFSDAPDISRDFAGDVESEAPQPTGCDF